MKQLDERALTVHLKISQWLGRKSDNSITKEVEDAHEASEAGNFTKFLIPRVKMKRVNAAVSALREFNRKQTTPWNEGGVRLLPAKNHLNYVSGLNDLRKEFNDAVEEFLSNYDSHIEIARSQLGTMFNINEYPTKEELKMKFETKVEYDTVPSTDFRVDGLSDEEKQHLKQQAEENMQRKLNEAMQDNWNKVKDTLVKMKEHLTKTREVKNESGGVEVKDGRLYNSVFDSVQELAEILPRLNITDDPNITAISEEMKNLVNVDVDNIRKDNTMRATKAQEVENLMDKFKDFL